MHDLSRTITGARRAVALAVALALASISLLLVAPLGYAGTPQKNPDGTIFWPCQGSMDVGSTFYQAHMSAADIDACGQDEILVGNTNGWLYCFNSNAGIKWSYYCGDQIQGAPACYDVDGDGLMEVFVGDFSGRMWGFDCHGQVLSKWGWPKQCQSGVEDGNANVGVFSSPAIGDINGDGAVDIVFGSWGSYIYAYSYNGGLLPGWPFNNKDSIWSSPALADIDMDGLKEVIIGADVSGGPDWPYPRGGLVYALNADLTHVPGWPQSTPEVIWSSPAVVDIDHDGWYEVVVGTGHYWKAVGQRTTEGHVVYCYRHDGSMQPGWPVPMAGSTFSSPSVGDVNGDGAFEVGIGCNAAAGIGEERLALIRPDGQKIWDIKPAWGGGPYLASPCLADINGDGNSDFIIGSACQMAAWDSWGNLLWNQTLNNLIITSPVAGDFDRDGFMEVAVGTGGDTNDAGTGTFYVFETGPMNGPADKIMPWSMFRRNSQHNATWLMGTEPPPPPPQTNFHEYLLFMNPGEEKAEIQVELMNESAQTVVVPWTVDPGSRSTMFVNKYMTGCGVSARVVSSRPIIAERAMYFNYGNRWKGGHDSVGALQPGKTWYLAEGCTNENFEEFVLVQNPGSAEAHLHMTFMREGLGPVTKDVTVAPKSRFTVNMKYVPGCESTSVSTKIESDVDIIAERAMYFNYNGFIGGHESIGVTDPGTHWYLAEGYTAELYDTFVLVQNPGTAEATVEVNFLRSDGFENKISFSLPGQSRKTIKVDSVPGFEEAQVSTEVTSDRPVIAERAMYFNSGGRDGGHDSIGVTEPASTWYLAEGYTGSTFDTYVLTMNPGDSPVNVKTTFMRADGHSWSRTDTLRPRSRFTLHVDEMPGFDNADVSTLVEALDGGRIISERAMYFVYNNLWADGHDSIGVNAPATTWYFAEGYTGN